MDVIKTIKWPLLIMAVISLFPQLGESNEAKEIEEIIFNLLRVALVLWAGWLVIAKKTGGLWLCAISGALMLLLSHVVIRGGQFLFQGEFTALLGVVISYFMFVGVAMVLAAIGGLGARAYHGNNT